MSLCNLIIRIKSKLGKQQISRNIITQFSIQIKPKYFKPFVQLKQLNPQPEAVFIKLKRLDFQLIVITILIHFKHYQIATKH